MRKFDVMRGIIKIMIGFDDIFVKKLLGKIITKWLRNKTGNPNLMLNFDSIRLERVDGDNLLMHMDLDLLIKEKEVLKLVAGDDN